MSMPDLHGPLSLSAPMPLPPSISTRHCPLVTACPPLPPPPSHSLPSTAPLSLAILNCTLSLPALLYLTVKTCPLQSPCLNLIAHITTYPPLSPWHSLLSTVPLSQFALHYPPFNTCPLSQRTLYCRPVTICPALSPCQNLPSTVPMSQAALLCPPVTAYPPLSTFHCLPSTAPYHNLS